jgi:hypothetical protein
MQRLSHQLGAPETLIRDWQRGLATIPERKWFKLVDILMEAIQTSGAKYLRSDPRSPDPPQDQAERGDLPKR